MLLCPLLRKSRRSNPISRSQARRVQHRRRGRHLPCIRPDVAIVDTATVTWLDSPMNRQRITGEVFTIHRCVCETERQMVRDRLPLAAASKGHSTTMSLDDSLCGNASIHIASVLRLNDIPIGIFPNDLAISEFQKVTPTDSNPPPIFGGARQSPLRH